MLSRKFHVELLPGSPAIAISSPFTMLLLCDGPWDISFRPADRSRSSMIERFHPRHVFSFRLLQVPSRDDRTGRYSKFEVTVHPCLTPFLKFLPVAFISLFRACLTHHNYPLSPRTRVHERSRKWFIFFRLPSHHGSSITPRRPFICNLLNFHLLTTSAAPSHLHFVYTCLCG